MSNSRGWIGVDLDGTLAQYSGWQGAEHIGEPVLLMAARVRQWLAEGKEVRIFTARVSNPTGIANRALDVVRVRNAIELWCRKHVGQRLDVTCEKDFAMVELWDDRAVQVVPNTGERVDEYKAMYEGLCE